MHRWLFIGFLLLIAILSFFTGCSMNASIGRNHAQPTDQVEAPRWELGHPADQSRF